jgi:hypothetical protein
MPDPAMNVYDPGPADQRHRESISNDSRRAVDEIPMMSTLDDLRAALVEVDEVAEQEFVPHELFSPGEVIRVLCSTDLDQAELKRLQLAAIPRASRGGKRGMPDVRKMDEALAFANIIGRQATEVALRQADGSYRPLAVADDAEGPFDDPLILAAFTAAEAGAAVRRIFVKDAYLIRAGGELVEACGYGERRPGESGDEDPT